MLDVARYVGRRGAVAAALVALGAVMEGLSLALLVPLLVVVMGGEAPQGRLGQMTAAVFGWLGLETPLARLILLLGTYMALMGAGAVIIYLRDVRVAALQIGFVEDRRARLVARLAATPWDRLSRLRHARITHVMSADIQRVGQAANLLLMIGVSTAMLIAQCVLVLLLAPALAAAALALLALTALAYLPVTRGAHAVGAMMTEQNLSLLDTTTQFLGGLKLAIGANLQASFVTEFRDTLGRLTGRQMDFRRQATKARLALSTLTGAAGGLLVLIGLTVFHVEAATLITLLYIIMRMSRIAGSLQQQGQQLAFAL
ncbi:MAG TPA: hypothetical protein VE224_14585, partial [Pseudolabrys sp.]|nr:hypothetical protein [Pseudolabrys sp.]